LTKRSSSNPARLLTLLALALAVNHVILKFRAAGGAGDQAPGSPARLPRKSWKRALRETKSALRDKQLPMLAAGAAFYATLAFFPALAGFVALFSLFAKPAQVAVALKDVSSYLPREMAALVTSELKLTLGAHTTNLVAAIVAIGLSLWSASSGVQNFIKAINEVYGVKESRGYFKLKLVSLLLVTAGLIIGFPLLALVVLQGHWLVAIGLPAWLADAITILRWVFIALLMAIALAVFYRYAPDQYKPKWQWVSWGAVAAIVVWLVGTLLFFLYARNFGNFSTHFGTFAGIIVLMTWLNLSAFIFLLGGQVNHKLEQQTDQDTTD